MEAHQFPTRLYLNKKTTSALQKGWYFGKFEKAILCKAATETLFSHFTGRMTCTKSHMEVEEET